MQPGEWSVSGDLVLPQDAKLVIGPGTTLLFETGAIMHASGPLEFLGTAEGPVVLGPQGESWGGIVVLKAGEPSSWDYVDVSGTSGISRQGWMLTGGITFFESPVVLQNCRITGSFGEDALNIIRTDFQIDACEFGDAASDAFDGDFVTGSITRSSFHDIANDAIDFSGSSVEVSEVNIRRVGDKGISVGEASNITVHDITFRETGIAIASKDLSHVDGGRITIGGSKIAGLAAYTKKAEFGPADITLDSVEFIDGGKRFLVATDSWVSVNGSLIDGTGTDEDLLIAVGILGN